MVTVKVISTDGYNDHNVSNVEVVEMENFDRENAFKWITKDDSEEDLKDPGIQRCLKEAEQHTCLTFIDQGVITVPFEEGGYVFVKISD